MCPQSHSIITTSANEFMQDIHDRMPVILPGEKEEAWLSDIPLVEVLRLLNPFALPALEAYEISPSINSPAHDTPEVLKAV